MRCLQAISPGAVHEEIVRTCRTVVNESMILAHEMRLTTAAHRWVVFSGPNKESGLLYGHDLNKYSLVDIKTIRELKPCSIKDHCGEKVIGQKLRSIFPGLVREGSKDGDEVLLVKETILVRIHDEFRQKKRKRSPVGMSSSEA